MPETIELTIWPNEHEHLTPDAMVGQETTFAGKPAIITAARPADDGIGIRVTVRSRPPA